MDNMISHNNSPIGVFDSGIGGLSVVKSMMTHLPHENIIYFGDIARLPYGTKSNLTIQTFTAQTVKFLLKQDVKAIVIACNTITAVAKQIVYDLAGSIPVIDVINAGSIAAAKFDQVGIIATPATIRSQAYEHAIHRLNPSAVIYTQECPLLVPLVEEGLLTHPATELITRDYLNKFARLPIEALILGCTHYPLIKEIIRKVIGNSIAIIDPADNICKYLITTLSQNDQLNTSTDKPYYKFCLTEVPRKFQQIGELFLGHHIENLEIVTLE